MIYPPLPDNRKVIEDAFLNLDYISEKPEDKTETIVSYVREIFEANRRAKQQIEAEMLASLARVNGIYPPQKIAELTKAGLPTVFVPITYHKCRDTESWLTEIHSSMGIDRTWDIEPDGNPVIPPQVLAQIEQGVRQQVMRQAIAMSQQTGQQMDEASLQSAAAEQESEIKRQVLQQAKEVAEERATNMEQKMLSQLETGGWERAFSACINDLARFKSCIMKGPIYRKKLVAVRFDDAGNSIIEPEITVEFERVNPFNWYPAPNSVDVDDGPAIELEPLQRKDFTKLLGVPGYKDDKIRAILEKYGSSGFVEQVPTSSERDYLEKNSSTSPVSDKVQKIDSLNYWGDVPGKLLLEWGMDAADIPDPDIDYQVNVKIVDAICFKAVLNPDILGRKPYGVSSFVKSNDSQWGKAPPDLMEDIQNGMNQAARALEYNVAMSSGPIIQVNIDMLADGETSEVYPGKCFETISKNLTTPAVRFDNAPMHTDELIRNMEFWMRRGDDLVVPSFSANGAVGADKTMGGRAMRVNAAARNIKLAVENVDRDLIVRMMTMLFNNNMRFLDDPSIKGALRVKARGASAQLRVDEMQQRLNEFKMSLRPEDIQIMGEKGMAYLLKETAKGLRLDYQGMIPNYEQIERSPSQPAAPPPNPDEQANMQAQTAKLQAEIAKIKSATILDIANAEAAEVGQQLEQYQAFTDRLSTDMDQRQQGHDQMMDMMDMQQQGMQ